MNVYETFTSIFINCKRSIEMSSKSQGFGMLAGGVLIGGLVGAVAVLLVAPQSGIQTRTMLMQKSGEVKGRIVSGVGETKVKALKAVDNVRDRAGKAVQKLRNPEVVSHHTVIEIINPEIPSDLIA
jgi:gas vesicle protein